jgi:DNA-binding MarR family transcriptional regulator
MERPFWTVGPVPPAYLADLAMARPQAHAAVLDAIGREGLAWVGGLPGSGRTTLVHQAVAALRRPFVVIDMAGLLKGDEEEALQAVRDLARRPAADAAEWGTAVRLWHPDAGLAIDGCGPEQEGWVRRVAASTGLPVLAVAAGPAGVPPDPIADGPAQDFLERRLRRLRMSWTPPALRETLSMAAGQPGPLQRVASGALHAALEQGRRRITIDDLLEGALGVAAQPASGLLDGLSPPKQALLKAMARSPEASPTEWARRCGLEPKAAVVHLRRLETGDGLVRRTGRGQYRLATPLLSLQMQGRHGTPVRLVVPPSGAGASRAGAAAGRAAGSRA